MELIRINNDKNGNPRYIFDYWALLNESEIRQIKKETKDPFKVLPNYYKLAKQKAKKIGAKSYRSKEANFYFVIQSHNIGETVKQIKQLENNTF